MEQIRPIPYISIIIPVYNAAPYLEACMESVLGQTLKETEIICINDGSTDESGAILEKYAEKDGRVKLLSQANAGQGAARNRGLREVTGKYAYFMDADDELAAPDALERIFGLMEAHSLDLALFDAQTRYDSDCLDMQGQIRSSRYIRRREYSAIRPGSAMFADMYLHGEWVACLPLALIRMGTLASSDITFPEGIIYEDNIFMLRTLFAAERTAHRPWQLYIRKVHRNTTITNPYTTKNLASLLECFRFVKGMLPPDGHTPSMRLRLALMGLRQRFKWLVNDAVRRLGGPEAGSIFEGLSSEESNTLHEAMRVSIVNRVGDAVRCLRDNGFAYTAKRLLRGRRKMC